ncbi:MAG: aminotransferase class III-fold pyridoxal phosphate-dependent enzyme [Bacteroidota bacterium]
MKLFDVYPLFDIAPVRAQGAKLWDAEGNEYLDLYGGHAVISIGHSHPHYVQRIEEQLHKMGFYSNSVQNPLQEELASKLGELSGYDDYSLFLINSGAEAIENALKLASFHTGREGVVMVDKAFHGRTSAAVAITDNPKIKAPLNYSQHVKQIPLNDLEVLTSVLRQQDNCALVLESLQGVGGVFMPEDEYLKAARKLCDETGTVLVMDEIQAGYGRSGKFFGHQHAGIKADLITIAKGMGNGFPIGGVMIGPQFEAWYGMLGTTFGGNHLACAAALAVLEVIESENLIPKAASMGAYLKQALVAMPEIKEVRGRGLMLGMELHGPAKPIRAHLLKQHHIFTGSSSHANTLRLLPPLNINQSQADQFLTALAASLKEVKRG